MDTEIQYKETGKINQQVIQEILEVEKEDGLTAESLLEKAKAKESSLHDLFDWNNTEAGEKWRLHQARVLINEVKIIVGNREMYAFENIKISVSNNEENQKDNQETSSRCYKPIVEILSNEEYRQQVIKSALENISYWKEKHQDFQELKPIFVSIERVKKNLNKKWQKKQ